MFGKLFGKGDQNTEVQTLESYVHTYGVKVQFATDEEADIINEQVSQELERVRGVLANVLPIETDKKQMCEDRIYDLETKLFQVEMALQGFPVLLKWDILKLRRKERFDTPWVSIQVPVFMVLDMYETARTMGIGRDGDNSVVTEPDLPEMIKDCYKDVVTDFYCINADAIKASFEGTIPDVVTEKVRNIAGTGIFEKVLMIAQVAKWNSVPLKGDPLVVGYKYDRLWVITQFDLQPQETWALDNLTSVF